MTPTTTPLGPGFVNELIPWMLKEIEKTVAGLYRQIWDSFLGFLWEHWIIILAILTLLLVFSFLRALTGHWGLFGSVLYNYFYFGTLFIIGLIWGPEVFANDFFKIFLVILYMGCFLLVGHILRKTGLKRW